MERRKNNQQQHHQQKGDSSDKNSNNSLVPVRLADIVIGTDITRGRGRPRKYPKNYQQQNSHTHNSEGTDNKNTNDNNKRGRGRPRKQDQQHFQLRPHNDNDYKETNKGSHSLTDKLPNKQGNISNQQNKSSMNMNIPGSNIAQRGPRPKQKIPPQHHHPQQQHRQHQVRTSGSPRPSSQQQQPARPALGGIGVQQQQLQQQSAPFPNCATDVLAQVGMLVKESAQNPRWNRVKVKDLQNLIDQDLLCLTPDRRSTRLNPLQYLRLLGIVCTYFNREVSNSDPQLRYMHFDIIFCGREGEVLLHDARIQFLVKICSLATQFPVYGLFEHVANWLSKVASDELKRSYAEKIVNELVEGFVLAPTEHKLHEYLLPLINHSFEFCANFIVFSICKETLGSVLALLIGDWLATRVDNFFHALNQNTHLSQPFCAQKFDLLLRYDCSKEAADKNADDEIHYRLHYVLVEITNMWRKRFEPQQQKRQAAVQQQSQNQLFMQPVVPNLEVAFQNIDALPALAQSRLLENLVCCIRVGFFPFHLLAPHRNRLSNLSAQQLAGPNGHLWQSLALFARAAQNE